MKAMSESMKYSKRPEQCVCRLWNKVGETVKGHHPRCRLVVEGDHLNGLTPTDALDRYPPGQHLEPVAAG